MSVVALYGGGFKPPTKGHYEVVKQTLEKYPEIDELKIIIGSKERDGVTQDEALRIWDIYNDSLPMKVTLEPSTKPPIRSIYNYAKDNPEDTVYWILGKREGNESDDLDIELRTRSIDKYPNIEVKKIETRGGVSGTQMRNAMNNKDEFLKFVPDEVKDKESVYNVINEAKKKKNLGIDAYALELAKLRENKNCGCGKDPCITYGSINEADPKKGTGKKPKGSGRRLYTDEDPSDTVGVKFSSRQDIVDTLNKKSFKAKSHARQSQIINLIHQRVRAALSRTKDPAKKKKLKSGFEYIKQKKEASKAKTQRLKNQKNENIDPKIQAKHKGKAAPYGSAYIAVEEGDTYEKMAAKGKKAGNLKQGTVRKRLNIPKGEKIPLSKIKKEISRIKKMKNPSEKNKKYLKALNLAKTLKTTTNLNEGLFTKNYWKSILTENKSASDLAPYILSLTQFMELNGLNLKPYPKVKFIHNDEPNAKDLFGRTAYYDSANNEVYLYTLMRHPKDILRSYAHELIHAHQNNEGRIHDITTTNVNQDKYLTDLEKEAYETGNILFRSWSDNFKE